MSHSLVNLALFCVTGLATLLTLANAQVVVNTEDVQVKFGFQGQVWTDWTQGSTAGEQGYQQSVYLRRARPFVAADIGDDISFFVDTDSPNLGKIPKSPNSRLLLLDASLAWKPTKVLQIDGGLLLVPFSHNALQSMLSYYTLDISSLATVDTIASASKGLRGLGLQANGFFMNDHLQYRFGTFQGKRDADGQESLRTAAYLQYDFFGSETGYFLPGTLLGQRRLLAVDVGAEKEGSYGGLSANATLDQPINGGDEIGGQFQYFHYDGRHEFASILDQNDWFVESAYYFHRAKLQPFARVESQHFVEAIDAAKDVHRAGAGANLYIRGQNLKGTFQYNRLLHPSGAPLRDSNEFTMQIQVALF